MRSLALVCSALLLALPQCAAAQSGACLTAREFTALSTYALPSAITGTSRTCAPALPADAYLRRSGAELAQRFAVAKPRAWPEAKAAFLKLASAQDQGSARLFAAMPDDALQQMTDAAVAGMISGQVKPDSCVTIDRALNLLAPLPVENSAELIAIAIGLGARSGQLRLGSLTICKA